MRSAPARTAPLALAALLVPLAMVPLAACTSPHRQISTSAGAPRQPVPSPTRGTGAASAAPVPVTPSGTAGGLVHSFTVRVSGYHGAGQYRGTLSATVSGPHGTVASLTGSSATTVALTRAGGTFRINVTGSGHHTLDTTVKWVCPQGF